MTAESADLSVQIEAALRHPRARLAPMLERLWEADAAGHQLGIMRSWLAATTIVNLGMLWADALSGRFEFLLGVVLRIGVTLPVNGVAMLLLAWQGPRGRAASLGAATVLMTVLPTVQAHYARPGLADRYVMAAGLAIFACNLLVPVRLGRAAVFSAAALASYVATAAAPFGPHGAGSPDLIFFVGLLTLASLRTRQRMQRTERQAFLLRLQNGLQTQALTRANAELSELSHTDPLTRAANRRRFDERLAALWQVPHGGALAVLMVDVDHFKRFNDTYGHLAGDACLRRVVDAMTRSLHGEHDTLARTGGEEFTVLLPGCGPQEAQAIADRLCRSVAALGLPHATRGDGVRVVTVSLGLASAGAGRTGAAEALVGAADAALYEAKRQGRNRVCAADPAKPGTRPGPAATPRPAEPWVCGTLAVTRD